MKDIFNVRLSKQAEKHLKSVPLHISMKLYIWIEGIEHSGLIKIRKISGYHDEPLKGRRLGQRSIRLSKSYRAVYIILNDNTVEFIEVIEVHKHDY